MRQTTLNIPDAIFQAAQDKIKKLGLSFSEYIRHLMINDLLDRLPIPKVERSFNEDDTCPVCDGKLYWE